MVARKEWMEPMKVVGTYFLGHENVRVALRVGNGGELYFCPKDKGSAIIIVGQDQDRWHQIVAVLLHEAIEFKLARQGNRFDPSPITTTSHASYVFMMTHEQMEDMASSVGPFLADCLPDLAKAWKLITKKK